MGDEAADLTPGGAEWLKFITGSKVAAIVGLSPWESPFSLWHRMKGNVPADDGNAATERGSYLESAILSWWRDRHDHRADRYSEQVRLCRPDLPWAFSTIDAETQMWDGERVGVEAKSAARDDKWGTPGTDEIPDYYMAQVQWGMHLSTIRRVYVPVLFGAPSFRFEEYVVAYDERIGAWLERESAAFHASLASDTPPDLDDTVPTFDTVKALHPDIDDRHVEVSIDVSDAYHTAAEALKAAKNADRLAKSTLLAAMGTARYATVNGERVARRQPARTGVALYPVTSKD